MDCVELGEMSQKSALFIAIAAVAVVLCVTAVYVLLAPTPALVGPKTQLNQPPDFAIQVDRPPTAISPVRGGVAGLADEDWVGQVSIRTGIPPRVLAAYAGVAIVKAQMMPECKLGWTTLAGIGLVESDHARHGGSTVDESGDVNPPIFGPSLDGNSAAHIPDSDGGEIDSDSDFDRAVGPMQLIPQTWRNWHIDANGDGVENPQNIDDSVMATANYLCRASGDMARREGWRKGIAAYNASNSYIQSVADAANRYRALSK